MVIRIFRTGNARRVILGAVIALLTATGAFASNVRPAYLDQRSEIVLPVGYNRNTAYPVFVVIPPTGGHASWVTSLFGLDPDRQSEFILLLPPGRPTRNEYLPDFTSFVGWYEERILADVRFVLDTYSADPRRVYLGGYSLGGDLSWALAVRNPDLFAGAVVAGSRASHPVDEDTLERLRERGFRGAFLIGNREDPDRYRGIDLARTRFETAGIEHRFLEYPGGHVIPPTPVFQDQIYYVTSARSLPDPSRPAGTPVAGRGTGRGLFDHTSRDRFALRLDVPVEVTSEGMIPPRETEFSLRVEWPWTRYYLRTTASYGAGNRTTDQREHRLNQDLLFGIGGDSGYYGVGVGWDWWRRFSDGGSYETMDLLLMRAIRNPWLIPAGRIDPHRVDSLILLRYRVPRGLFAGPASEQLLNGQVEYMLRIADLFVLDAAAGTYTVQNAPVDSLDELSDALDHRYQWEVGLGFRAPSPLLWRVGYRGINERALAGDDDYRYRSVWSATVEFSY